jgi:hypothetical protein
MLRRAAGAAREERQHEQDGGTTHATTLAQHTRLELRRTGSAEK